MLEDVTFYMIFPVVYFRVNLFLREVRRIVWGDFPSAIALEIRFLFFFNPTRVFGLVFSRLYFCHPHISPPLCGGMILLYPLIGRGTTSHSSRMV